MGWLAYNQHFFHDPLDFIRGPYSASAIEKKTAAARLGALSRMAQPFLGAACYYTRTAQVDVAFWETGFLVMIAAIWWRDDCDSSRKLAPPAMLLWMPLPFYVYSIAYGSVPIFIPQLWPHSYYNSRYGMEMLPALAFMAWSPGSGSRVD